MFQRFLVKQSLSVRTLPQKLSCDCQGFQNPKKGHGTSPLFKLGDPWHRALDNHGNITGLYQQLSKFIFPNKPKSNLRNLLSNIWIYCSSMTYPTVDCLRSQWLDPRPGSLGVDLAGDSACLLNLQRCELFCFRLSFFIEPSYRESIQVRRWQTSRPKPALSIVHQLHVQPVRCISSAHLYCWVVVATWHHM